MWSSLEEYHRPPNRKVALQLLARAAPRTVPLAGGSWLVAQRDPAIQAVVDLSALELATIRASRNWLRLGAMTTLQTLITDPDANEFADGLLAKAARQMGPPARRNVATVGGTLIAGGNTAVLTLTLLVLQTQIIVYAPTRRTISLDDLLAEPLPPGSLITEVVVPAPPANFGAALESVSRTPRDTPIVNAVAVVARSGGRYRHACLALGGIAPTPVRLPAVASQLAGRAHDEETLTEIGRAVRAAVNPPTDSRATAAYRREMASVVAVRALRLAWQQAERRA